ncbi:MAG TPA: hypothetical protein VMV39_03735 [Terracidiphilus sp.]|nr:hypothetical protein [Terracidiphilus sp.]
MPIIVVGGSSKNVGKTALVCGLIAALPEFAWTAVKITSHEHGKAESIWEETAAGTETDTARYLAAGARRAFLISTDDADLPFRLGELQAKLEAGAHLIFESNRILQHVQPDIFLAVEGGPQSEEKLSFREVAHPMTARVVRGELDFVSAGATPLFQLAALDRISAEMQLWIRERLADHRDATQQDTVRRFR